MTEQTETLPVLYILMRDDLDSMNPGKAMAQASHASNAFVYDIVQKTTAKKLSKDISKGVAEWRTSTPQGFGTVLVLAVDGKQMNAAVQVANATGYVAGVVNDPTYPIKDAEAVFYGPMDTCAYFYCPDKNTDTMLPLILGNFDLHP